MKTIHCACDKVTFVLLVFFLHRGPKVAQNKRGLGAGPENHIDKDILKQLPEKGEFDLKEVLDSVYFFS